MKSEKKIYTSSIVLLFISIALLFAAVVTQIRSLVLSITGATDIIGAAIASLLFVLICFASALWVAILSCKKAKKDYKTASLYLLIGSIISIVVVSLYSIGLILISSLFLLFIVLPLASLITSIICFRRSRSLD